MKNNFKKIISVLIALVGMIFVSGILETGIDLSKELLGVGFALLAALLYSSVILMKS